jgi:hypothetical protein
VFHERLECFAQDADYNKNNQSNNLSTRSFVTAHVINEKGQLTSQTVRAFIFNTGKGYVKDENVMTVSTGDWAMRKKTKAIDLLQREYKIESQGKEVIFDVDIESFKCIHKADN